MPREWPSNHQRLRKLLSLNRPPVRACTPPDIVAHLRQRVEPGSSLLFRGATMIIEKDNFFVLTEALALIRPALSIPWRIKEEYNAQDAWQEQTSEGGASAGRSKGQPRPGC